MEILDRYELILSQALQELGPLEIPAEQQEQFEFQAVTAPDLGDVLYRLTVEHAVAFTPFRETVISLITQRSEVATTPGLRPGTPFAAHLEESHHLILLALEMMPPDAPF